MDPKEKALKLHSKHPGKIEIKSTIKLVDREDLSLAYTPGVAEPCKEIYNNLDNVYKYTSKGNMVAIVTDGSAVLGLGDIGPEASLPVMEGKSILFKHFSGLDAFPVCINTKDENKIVETIKLTTTVFGGINLEDISAPRCFSIEERLKKEIDIPVFHDDQHGTAIVVTAGLFNAVKISGRNINELKIVVNGAGAAGIAIVKLLLHLGVEEVILCDSLGIVYPGRSKDMNVYKEEIAQLTDPYIEGGSLADALRGAHGFIGVSVAGAVDIQMVKSMEDRPFVFALANPVPEIMPHEAREGGAEVIATGRSDFPNQINNVLAFPGVLRGAMEVRANDINNEMKIGAAKAIAELIIEEELTPEFIIPQPFDTRVAPVVAASVAEAAIKTGVADREVSPEAVYEKTRKMAQKIK
ncbi:MAG: NAD-dependent malic enzyme [Candidatus Syntrophonatronum acetioxidans]|uniref:NAD-dependent malic enzyme n=1 Tax=Candidatus Syntrophonatronum acetioxidans TaxID=1795816 RepID=A0A424YBN8_9FIRM|nr:MAG: NAD-dependent malic enzyme [Candidatus Syntrophonatronum acetioxidans]